MAKKYIPLFNNMKVVGVLTAILSSVLYLLLVVKHTREVIFVKTSALEKNKNKLFINI